MNNIQDLVSTNGLWLVKDSLFDLPQSQALAPGPYTVI